MNVLSTFDGPSIGLVALERAGIPVTNYFSSEIDKYAIQISKKNHGDKVIQLGDITNWREWNLPKIDLLLGGSPCQGVSLANSKRKNLEDERSKLFYTYVDILNNLRKRNPNLLFLLENTRMDKDTKNTITEEVQVSPIELDSALVSAQSRKRLYWFNWYMEEIKDRYIYLEEVVLSDVYPVALSNLYGGFKEKAVRVHTDKSPTIRTARGGGGHIPSLVLKELEHSPEAIAYMDRKRRDGRTGWDFGHHSDIRHAKSAAVVANFFKGVPYNVFKDWEVIRKFHPTECEALQTWDINYTEGVSNTQRYKMIGNGWTIELIVEILNCMPRIN